MNYRDDPEYAWNILYGYDKYFFYDVKSSSCY